MRKSSFSPEKVSEMASLYGANESLKSIGAKFGANPQTVCRLLKNAGIVIRPRGRPSKGEVATEPVVPTVTDPAVPATTDVVKNVSVPTTTRVVSF